MNLSFKPMLACSTIPELDEIKYPVYASPKIDGVRCIAGNGVAFSRTMKRIPNRYIQDMFTKLQLHGLDGELYVPGKDFNAIQSIVMSEYHLEQHQVVYCVFDDFRYEEPFEARLGYAHSQAHTLSHAFVCKVKHMLVHNAGIMQEVLNEYFRKNWEGAIVRDPEGPYKQGRSTMRQGWMLKLKRFYDAEALIIDAEELMHNEDTSTQRKENMVPGNTLGALVVRYKNKQFKIGTGFDQEQRDRLWALHQQGNLVGCHVTFKYQDVSRYGIPRFPVYKGLRHPEDI